MFTSIYLATLLNKTEESWKIIFDILTSIKMKKTRTKFIIEITAVCWSAWKVNLP
jgi:hypothetical protein